MTIQNLDGTVQTDRFDSTDVTAAFVTWKSAGGEKTLEVLKNGHIVDIVLNITTAGDTKDFKLWLNQRDSNIRWVQSACFPNLATHFPNNNPIPVSAGTKLMMEAIT